MCNEPGCTEPHYSRGKCKYHYHKVRREAPDSLAPTGWGKWRGKTCSTEGCDAAVFAKGLCLACSNKAVYAERKTRGVHYDPQKRSDAHLKMQYGITGADYDRMFAEQSGVCAICGEPAHDGNTPAAWKVRKLAVDHCHTTGKVRALLCNSCNLVVKDRNTPDLLRKAIAYLEHYAGRDRSNNP